MAELYRYAVKPVRVVDGDTIVFDINLGFNITKRDYVRLVGVNTPEISGPHASAAGQTSKAFTVAWIANRPALWIQSHRYDEREKYGRVLATVWAEGDPISLNDALIEGAFGVPME